MARLGDVCEINPRAPKDIADDAVVSFLPMSAVSEGGFVSTEEMRTYKDVKKGYTYFERGDVLVAKITPCFENGKAALADSISSQLGFGSTEFHVVRPSPDVDAKYVFYLLWNKKFRAVAEKGMTGSAGQKRVPADLLKRLEIPLPPLDEQKRIAAILDKVDQLRKKRRRAVALLDTLTQSIFLEMFGDPISNPKGWPSSDLARVCVAKSGIKAGPFGSALKKEDYQKRGYRIYGQEQVIAGSLTIGDYYISESKYKSLNSCAVATGDILLSLVGSFGRAVIVPSKFEAGIINPRLLRIRPDTSKVSSVFLQALITSHSVQKLLLSKSRGGTMGILNAGIVSSIPVMQPLIEKQLAFEEHLAKVSELNTRARKDARSIGSLFAALQHRAFSGQL
jgi:type I restriction enzyme S subunit